MFGTKWSENEDLMIATQSGVVIRIKVADISIMGRYAQGVRLIRVDEDEILRGGPGACRGKNHEKEEKIRMLNPANQNGP